MRNVKAIAAKFIIFFPALLLIIALSTCQLFLGPDPDDSPRGIFDTIWNDFNVSYALFNHKGIDWNKVYDHFSAQIYQGMSSGELENVCRDMLSVLEDAHVSLNGFDTGSLGTYSFVDGEIVERQPFTHDLIHSVAYNNYISPSHSSFFNLGAGYGFTYGRFKNSANIGYLRINGFDKSSGFFNDVGSWAKAIDGILQYLMDTDALVLDIRNNYGGLATNMFYIASRFVSTQTDFATVRTKSGPGHDDFSASATYTIKPAGTRYTKPVILLTNNQSVSNAEMFTLALLTQPNVIHVGSTTRGALSTRIIKPLINGWHYTLSIQIKSDMNGICWEGIGISPNPENISENTKEELDDRIDTQLQFALDTALIAIQ